MCVQTGRTSQPGEESLSGCACVVLLQSTPVACVSVSFGFLFFRFFVFLLVSSEFVFGVWDFLRCSWRGGIFGCRRLFFAF